MKTASDLNKDDKGHQGNFTLTDELIGYIFEHAKPLGHNQDQKNLNLGFGFIYYALVRAVRPKHIVVIGSGYGFSVICLALGIKDNGTGSLTFVDPAYSLLKDGPFKTIGGVAKWENEAKVFEHFKQFGVEDIVRHYKLRSDEFFPRFYDYNLPPIDIAFIDGNHAFKDVWYDFLNTAKHAHKNSYIFLHDTNIYIREILRHAGVKKWLRILKTKQDAFEAMDFPFDCGVAIVRVLKDKAWKSIS